MWVGLGPSVTVLKTWEMLYEEQSSTSTSIGLVAEAGLRWPAASRLFFDMKAQYRWAASTDLGPFRFAPSVSAAASHACVTIGLGLRLGSPAPGN